MPVILAFRRKRQEDLCQFDDSLGCRCETVTQSMTVLDAGFKMKVSSGILSMMAPPPLVDASFSSCFMFIPLVENKSTTTI